MHNKMMKIPLKKKTKFEVKGYFCHNDFFFLESLHLAKLKKKTDVHACGTLKEREAPPVIQKYPFVLSLEPSSCHFFIGAARVFNDLSFLFFSFSLLPENYRLTHLVIGISISVLILLISHFWFWIFCISFICF
jgi:hypothetical protein